VSSELRRFPNKNQVVADIKELCSEQAEDFTSYAWNILRHARTEGFRPRGLISTMKQMEMAFKTLAIGNDRAYIIMDNAMRYFQLPRTKVYNIQFKFAHLRHVVMRSHQATWDYFLVLSIHRDGKVTLKDRTVGGIKIQEVYE